LEFFFKHSYETRIRKRFKLFQWKLFYEVLDKNDTLLKLEPLKRLYFMKLMTSKAEKNKKKHANAKSNHKRTIQPSG